MKKIKFFFIKSFILIITFICLLGISNNKVNASETKPYFELIQKDTSKNSFVVGDTISYELYINQQNNYYLYGCKAVLYASKVENSTSTDDLLYEYVEIKYEPNKIHDGKDFSEVYTTAYLNESKKEYSTIVYSAVTPMDASIIETYCDYNRVCVGTVKLKIKDTLPKEITDFYFSVLPLGNTTQVSYYERDKSTSLVCNNAKKNLGTGDMSKSVSITEASSDPKIDVKVNDTTYNFSDTVKSYTHNLAQESKASILISSSVNAKIESINSSDNKTYSGNSFEVNVEPGNSVTLTFKTIAENNTTRGEYKLILTKDKDQDNTLNKLEFSLEGTTLKHKLYNEQNTSLIAFSKDITKYTLRIPASTTAIKVKPTTSSSYSTITINDNSVNSGNNYSITNLSTFTIKVKAQNNSEKDYVINVYKMSNDTSLTSLTVKDLDDNIISLDQSYKATVSYKVTGFKVSATANEKAKVSISSDITYFTSSLKEEKTCKITVTAEDETTKEYVISITKEGVETGADIKTLNINGIDITTLNETINIIDLSLEGKTPTISLTISQGATYETTLSNITTYNHGLNTFTITVKSQDEKTNNIYTVNIYCLNNDLSISNIKFYGDEKEITDFSKNNNEYQMTVNSSVSKFNSQINLTATETEYSFDKTLPYQLNDGENVIILTIKSEYGKITGNEDGILLITIKVTKQTNNSGGNNGSGDSGNNSGGNNGSGDSGNNSGGNNGSGDSGNNSGGNNGSGDSGNNSGGNNGSGDSGNNSGGNNGSGDSGNNSDGNNGSGDSGNNSGGNNGSGDSGNSTNNKNNTSLIVICVVLGVLVIILGVALIAVKSLKKNNFEKNMKKR